MAYKGTAPTYILTLPKDIKLNEATNIYVTFAKNNYTVVLTKTGDDLTISNNTISVFLTQEDTLKFQTDSCLLQVNWTYDDAGVTKRACTEIVSIPVKRNLINEVIS